MQENYKLVEYLVEFSQSWCLQLVLACEIDFSGDFLKSLWRSFLPPRHCDLSKSLPSGLDDTYLSLSWRSFLPFMNFLFLVTSFQEDIWSKRFVAELV